MLLRLSSSSSLSNVLLPLPSSVDTWQVLAGHCKVGESGTKVISSSSKGLMVTVKVGMFIKRPLSKLLTLVGLLPLLVKVEMASPESMWMVKQSLESLVLTDSSVMAAGQLRMGDRSRGHRSSFRLGRVKDRARCMGIASLLGL